ACLGRIYQGLRARNGAWLITADHGNAETMIDPATGGVHTAHTTNPVPFVGVGSDCTGFRAGGALCDVAPTVLGLLGLTQPAEMTGRDLRRC
ncbi:MAG TPA: 2,3-bisphosphoglycerate-independent phosphoglycerate mutase, partial [Gemmatimonadales bacterium]